MTRIWMPSRYAVRLGVRSTPVSRFWNAALRMVGWIAIDDANRKTHHPILLMYQGRQRRRLVCHLMRQQSGLNDDEHRREIRGLIAASES